MSRPLGVHHRAEVLGVLLSALALGAAAAWAVSNRSTAAVLLVLVVLGGLSVAAGGRLVLLAVAFVDVALQVDKHLLYDEAAASIGALGGISVSLTTVVVVLLYAGWAADGLGRAVAVPGPRLRPTVPLAVYVVVSVISTVWAADRLLSAFAAVLLIQTYLLVLYVVSRVRTRPEVVLLLGWLVVGLAVSAVVLVVQGLTGSVVATPGGGPARPGGTVGSANTAGSHCAALCLVAAGVLLSTSPRWLRRLSAVALPAGLAGLVLTQSRGAWIGFAVGLLLLLVVAARRRWLSASRLLSTVGIVLLVVASLWSTVVGRLRADDDGSARSRGPLNELALQMLHDHPLTGVGLNNVGRVLPSYAGPDFSTAWLYTVHNKYLLVAAEAGVPGLLAFLVFLVAALGLAARGARSGDSAVAPVAAGLGCAVVSQLLHMFVDLFQNRAQVQLLWSLVALLVVLHATAGHASDDGDPGEDDAGDAGEPRRRSTPLDTTGRA